MTTEEAKQILLRHRPWVTDVDDDPELAEARALCRNDAALQAWFDDHCRSQEAIRGSFRQIAPPAGLKEQILSEYQAAQRSAAWRKPLIMAAAALVMLGIAAVLFWNQINAPRPDEFTLSAYRTRMVRFALSAYSMELETDNLQKIRAYLAQHNCPANFKISESLAHAKITGCATTRWQGEPVSMICFLKNESSTNATSDLWLFVMADEPMKDLPQPGAVSEAQVSRLFTATWRADGKVYLLGTEGGAEELRQWF